MILSREALNEVTEDVEDMAQYLCDRLQISGELFWIILSSLSEAKTAHLHGVVK